MVTIEPPDWESSQGWPIFAMAAAACPSSASFSPWCSLVFSCHPARPGSAIDDAPRPSLCPLCCAHFADSAISCRSADGFFRLAALGFYATPIANSRWAISPATSRWHCHPRLISVTCLYSTPLTHPAVLCPLDLPLSSSPFFSPFLPSSYAGP